MYNVLLKIAKAFNQSNIVWGVGASVMLSFYGLVERPNDIDISVAEGDILRAKEILTKMGKLKEKKANDNYSTEHFYEFVIDGIDIDVMGGLKINHEIGVYQFDFGQSSITKHQVIDNIEIPLVSLEDWYIIYQLIPGREAKVKVIEDHLKSTGINNLYLLKNALKKCLPNDVNKRIKQLIET